MTVNHLPNRSQLNELKPKKATLDDIEIPAWVFERFSRLIKKAAKKGENGIDVSFGWRILTLLTTDRDLFFAKLKQEINKTIEYTWLDEAKYACARIVW